MSTAATLATPTLLITNSLGVVHALRADQTCNVAENAPRRKTISTLQAQVFGLTACEVCFPVEAEYRRLIRRVPS